MAANVRYRSQYYNTTVTGSGGVATQWTLEILDTEAVAGVINFESDHPVLQYEGLTQDIKAGDIYPTNLHFVFNIRQSAKAIAGVTFGPSEGFIDDLFTSDEGRFFARLKQDGVIIFIGVIRPDECEYEDQASPYPLTIKAQDGLYKLQTENYVPANGYVKYHSLLRFSPINGAEFDSAFVTTASGGEMLVGSEWVAVEHISEKHTFLGIPTDSYRKTTYARSEQYAITSPGTGWVDQGTNLWAKEIVYDNEVIVDESHLYHLTRDISSTSMRELSEYIKRCMLLIPTGAEYGEGCMYDVCNRWYEQRMSDFVSDPYTFIRWSEKKFAIGNTYADVAKTILLHFNSRLYYSNGRYHWEQLSERGETTIIRHTYDYLGNFLVTESAVDLDIDCAAEEITRFGSFRFMAPLKKVTVTIPLNGDNLLENIDWDLKHQGTRNIARIKTTEDDTRLLIIIHNTLKTTFDATLLLGLTSAVRKSSTQLTIYVTFKIWIVHIETGTTYYLTPSGVITPTGYPDYKTWDTDPVAGFITKTFNAEGIHGTGNFDIFNEIQYTLNTLTDELPGDLGDSFDIFVSVNYAAVFANASGQFWTVTNPTKYKHDFHSWEERMTTVDVNSDPVNANAEKAYEVVNSVNNSLESKISAIFCDTGMGEESMQIKTNVLGGVWIVSKIWSIGGTGGGVEHGQLLAQETMALRMIPLRVYSGTYVTSRASVENRLIYLTYIYLPLGASIDTHIDGITGEFINISRTTPPDSSVTEIPSVGVPTTGLSGVIGDDGTLEPLPEGFETNAAITAGSTLTTVLIINTDGVHVGIGEVVKIVNSVTGVFEFVTLTAEVLPTSTSMTFVSYTFISAYPQYSPLVLLVEDFDPSYVGLPYRFKSTNYSLAYHIFPTYYMFPDPEANSPVVIDDKISIWRNGNKMQYNAAAAGMNEWSIDYANRKAIFPVSFGSLGDAESIQIYGK